MRTPAPPLRLSRSAVTERPSLYVQRKSKVRVGETRIGTGGVESTRNFVIVYQQLGIVSDRGAFMKNFLPSALVRLLVEAIFW